MSGEWIGVDLDGTLAHYEGYRGPEHIGEPVPAMRERVMRWLAEGREVRIFTARVFPLIHVPAGPENPLHGGVALGCSRDRIDEAWAAAKAIRAWCETNVGQALPVTCVKDYSMIELYDDRAVQVRPNTGELVGQSTRGLS